MDQLLPTQWEMNILIAPNLFRKALKLPIISNKTYARNDITIPYHRQTAKANRTQWPIYILLILFVGGWLALIDWMLIVI